MCFTMHPGAEWSGWSGQMTKVGAVVGGKQPRRVSTWMGNLDRIRTIINHARDEAVTGQDDTVKREA